MAHSTCERPIGVFDSGVGGLSVLQALQRELPQERFVYVSDAGHAPYGEKDDVVVLERSRTIVGYLRRHHHIKALVVACNTATAAAIETLRTQEPDLSIVGIEPAVKPALANSKTGRVAVMATRGTLGSQKFRTLLASLPQSHGLVLQACDGLANAIEQHDATKIEALCAHYTRAIGPFGLENDLVDTLVLGCTHYPFVQETLRTYTGTEVAYVECGAPVARQTRKLLAASSLLSPSAAEQACDFLTSGDPTAMKHALKRWLGVSADVHRLPSR